MPLRDHFQPPLSTRRHWHSFHNAWATFLASDLNARLPEGYFAEPNVQFGIEIDVAAFSDGPSTWTGDSWTPPAPTLTIPFAAVTDAVEVAIYDSTGGPTLAAAIELVSPANKDRPEQRSAYVAKCATYLQSGVGLVVIDAVTARRANLHQQLLEQVSPSSRSALTSELFAVAYHPVDRGGQATLDIWECELRIGQALPVVPLWLRGDISMRLNLESSYERTCREQRLPA